MQTFYKRFKNLKKVKIMNNRILIILTIKIKNNNFKVENNKIKFQKILNKLIIRKENNLI